MRYKVGLITLKRLDLVLAGWISIPYSTSMNGSLCENCSVSVRSQDSEKILGILDNQIRPFVIFFLWGYLKSKGHTTRPTTLAAQKFLSKDLIILSHGQVMKTKPKLAPPLHHTTAMGGHLSLSKFKVYRLT
ncbi:hypothetical protein TNCV_3899181 [Trichonephila clavipes]|nr:hypothetical protein TNCV_3899181 [Trichonephila clavipes]